MNKTIFVCLITIVVLAASLPAWSQATWEGPTGVFLNPLALTQAQGKWQASAHFLDLEPVGSLTTLGVTYGGGKWEAGYTRANLAVGAPRDFAIDTVHAKLVVVPFKDEWPQIAIGGIARSTHGGDSTNDIYLAATKIFKTSTPIIASLTVRNTNANWSGLGGKAADRSTDVGGFLGFVVKPNLILGTEYYGQGDAPAWSDLAFRWTVSPNTFIDGGVAHISHDWNRQVAVALTHQW